MSNLELTFPSPLVSSVSEPPIIPLSDQESKENRDLAIDRGVDTEGSEQETEPENPLN